MSFLKSKEIWFGDHKALLKYRRIVLLHNDLLLEHAVEDTTIENHWLESTAREDTKVNTTTLGFIYYIYLFIVTWIIILTFQIQQLARI